MGFVVAVAASFCMSVVIQELMLYVMFNLVRNDPIKWGRRIKARADEGFKLCKLRMEWLETHRKVMRSVMEEKA